MRVGVEQRVRRLAFHDQRQLPHEVVHILKARVRPACAKGRDLVRRVAHKQHAAVAKIGHAAALEGVDAHPLQLKRPLVAQHGLQTRDDFFGLLFFFGVGVPAELKIDAPDVVALLVQQHTLVGVKRRVEPEPALGRVVGLHDHVGNQEAILKHTAFDVQAQMAANGAACAIGHHQPVGFDVKVAVGRFHRQGGVVALAVHGSHFVLPADVGPERQSAGDQHLLDVVLLEVDHAGALVACVRHQVELVDLVFFQKGATDVPAHTHVASLLGDAQPIQNFERSFGVAHRPRADRHRLVVVEHQHVQALQTGVDGSGQAHRPGSNDDQRLALRWRRPQVGG